MTLPTKRRAFTLIEVIVVSSLVVVAIASLYSGLIGGRQAVNKGFSHLDRLGKINRILQYCKRVLRYTTSIEKVTNSDNTKYVINYVESFKGSKMQLQLQKMEFKSSCINDKTTIVITYLGQENVYLLDGLNFSFSLKKNLALVKLTYLDGTRPPVALSLFAPFIDPLAVFDFGGSSVNNGEASDSAPVSSIQFHDVDFSNKKNEPSVPDPQEDSDNDPPEPLDFLEIAGDKWNPIDKPIESNNTE